MRATSAAALCAVLLAVPATADARSIYASKHLWATINICDTEGHPDGVGVRGSMPGSGFRDEGLWMRFQLQFLKPSDGKWHNLGPAADTGFDRVGNGLLRRREAGHTFTVTPPATGSYTLRGVVTFEWRRAGEVVRRARKATRAGKRPRIAEPKGFSAATCVVRP